MDLKKPLEGVPGLLLMAALILFGATIGISFAIVLKWIDLGDALANFLGGVVGAGLGAALAVIGAVYVQTLERRERLSPSLNLLRLELENLRAGAIRLVSALARPDEEFENQLEHDGEVRKLAVELHQQAASFPPFIELPRHLHEPLKRSTKAWELDLRDLAEELLNPSDQIKIRYDRALTALEDRTIPSINQLLGMVDAMT